MPNGHGGFSFPYGVPIVAYGVLALGAASPRWGLVFAAIALVLAAVFTWEGLSRREYEKIHAKDPTLNLVTWRFNWLVFFAAPGYVVALVGVVARL